MLQTQPRRPTTATAVFCALVILQIRNKAVLQYPLFIIIIIIFLFPFSCCSLSTLQLQISTSHLAKSIRLTITTTTMPLRDILHKKDKIHGTNTNIQDEPTIPSTFVSPVPEIRFVSSDTTSNEPINTTTPSPPHGDDDDVDHHNTHHLGPSPPSSTSRKSLNVFRRSSRSPSESSVLPPSSSTTSSPPRARRERSLSQLLHLDRSPSRSPSPVSVNIPADLLQIEDGKGDAQDREAQWEKRATVLVQRNERFGAVGLSPSPSFCSTGGGGGDRVQSRSRSSSRVSIADPDGDVCEESHGACVVWC